MSGFTVSMFVLQLFSFSFFTLLVLNQFDKTEKTNGIVYIQIFTFLFVFILSKFLIEKILATAFKIEEFNEQFNSSDTSPRNIYTGTPGSLHQSGRRYDPVPVR